MLVTSILCFLCKKEGKITIEMNVCILTFPYALKAKKSV